MTDQPQDTPERIAFREGWKQAVECASPNEIEAVLDGFYPPPEPAQTDQPDIVEQAEKLCEQVHWRYELAAAEEGWQTQENCRVDWAQVPDANKRVMRKALGPVADTIVRSRFIERVSLPDMTDDRDVWAMRAKKAEAEVEKLERRLEWVLAECFVDLLCDVHCVIRTTDDIDKHMGAK